MGAILIQTVRDREETQTEVAFCEAIKFHLWNYHQHRRHGLQDCTNDSWWGRERIWKDGSVLGGVHLDGVGRRQSFLCLLLDLQSKRIFSPALHLAVMHGRLNNIRALLTECTVDAEAFNLRWVWLVPGIDQGTWWSSPLPPQAPSAPE